jgi:hypothetical protein
VANQRKRAGLIGLKHLAALMLTLALFAGANDPSVRAQTPETDNWSDPVNLSKSGGMTNPYIVTDADGTVHVFWDDEYANMVYSRGDGNEWETASTANLPFNDSVYKIVPDNRGRLLALWMDADNNFYSSVANASDAGQEAAWQNQTLIARGVVGFDISVDANNQFHAVFALAAEDQFLPTGVYYMATARDTTTWGNPRLLYESRYYRTLLPPPGTVLPATSQGTMLTRLSVVASVVESGTKVFAGWEDRALKRVFFSRLDDGVWTDPVVIDGPESLASYQYPRNITFHAQDSQILMLWDRSDQNGPVCTQQYQYSTDGGLTWSPQGELWKEFGTCPDEFKFLDTGQGFPLIFAKVQDQVFLLLWDGTRFSIPQNQIQLNSLQNPDTLDVIDFSCQQGALRGNLLVVAGCDRGVGGDIWVLSRTVEYSDAWFDRGITWSEPASVVIGEKSVNTINAVDNGGSVLAFWGGASADITTDFPAISVVSWDGSSIIGPYELHRIRDGNPADITTMVIRDSQRIIQMWQSGLEGELFYSWAGARDATNPVNWSEFSPLRGESAIGESPKLIQIGESILAFFAVPFNENRGIYSSQSLDDGSSWSAPVRIADIHNLKCTGANQLSVGNDLNGYIHLVFSCLTQPGGIGSVELFGIRSTDAGISWSEPVSITNKSVTWARVVTIDNDQVVRLWNETDRQADKLWFSLSKDRGSSWETPGNFFTSETPIRDIDLVVDQSGGMHLLLSRSQTSTSNLTQIEYVRWSGNAWERGQTLEINRTILNQVDGLSAAISGGNVLTVAVTGVYTDFFGRTESRIVFSQLTLQNLVPTDNPIPRETLPVIPVVPETVVESTPTMESITPPAEQVFPRQPVAGMPPWMGIVIGGFLSILLVAGVVLINRIQKKNFE